MTEIPQRILNKIEVTGFCWNWTAGQNGAGYGWLSMGERRVLAHRYMYESLVGAIPGGLTLDHLCWNTLCVNPDHLEPVTPGENVRRSWERRPRKTHCINGHEFTPSNTGMRVRRGRPRPIRVCRKCNVKNVQRGRARGLAG